MPTVPIGIAGAFHPHRKRQDTVANVSLLGQWQGGDVMYRRKLKASRRLLRADENTLSPAQRWWQFFIWSGGMDIEEFKRKIDRRSITVVRLFLIVIGLVFFGFALKTLFTPNNGPSEADYQAAMQRQTQKRTSGNITSESRAIAEATTFCKGVAKGYLKSPETADFAFMADEGHLTSNSNSVVISSHVDARNSYNAEIRLKYVCQLRYEGGGLDGWYIESFNMSE